MTLRCLFVDFDSYFASVEQYDDPRLRERPVGVVPVMTDSTCCLAASYEAKAVGVKTGTGVREARGKCPGIRLVLARPARYIELHHQLTVFAVELVVPTVFDPAHHCADGMGRADRPLIWAQPR